MNLQFGHRNDFPGIEIPYTNTKLFSASYNFFPFGVTLASSMNDWQTFVKEGMSSLISGLTDSNNEIKSLLEDPALKEYFETDKSELNSLLDISKLAASNLVFGKWVAKKVQSPCHSRSLNFSLFSKLLSIY